jgi:hypothetical protein
VILPLLNDGSGFKSEQVALAVKAASVACELAFCTKNSVARDDD